MHLKTDYEADSSLRNWGIKHNDERITVFVTIKNRRIYTLSNSLMTYKTLAYRMPQEMRALLKVTLLPNLRRKRRLCSSSETNILLRNDITVAATSIEVLLQFHLLNV